MSANARSDNQHAMLSVCRRPLTWQNVPRAVGTLSVFVRYPSISSKPKERRYEKPFGDPHSDNPGGIHGTDSQKSVDL
jgi:hypothetical protein